MSLNTSVQKRIRQALKANARNKHYRSMMKTAIRKVRTAQTKDEAAPLLKNAIATIDKVAGKGIIHKNKAGNQKSNLTKFVNNLQ